MCVSIGDRPAITAQWPGDQRLVALLECSIGMQHSIGEAVHAGTHLDHTKTCLATRLLTARYTDG